MADHAVAVNKCWGRMFPDTLVDIGPVSSLCLSVNWKDLKVLPSVHDLDAWDFEAEERIRKELEWTGGTVADADVIDDAADSKDGGRSS